MAAAGRPGLSLSRIGGALLGVTFVCGLWLVCQPPRELVAASKHEHHLRKGDSQPDGEGDGEVDGGAPQLRKQHGQHGKAIRVKDEKEHDRFASLSVLGLQLPSEEFGEWIMQAPPALPGVGTPKLGYRPNFLIYLGTVPGSSCTRAHACICTRAHHLL
jgi:hypothetical protein